MAESTTVAKRDTGSAAMRSAISPEAQAMIEANKARNAIATAIRATMWGKDLNQLQQRALAEYCRQNNLDAVRHVEVLGGKVYLLAEFYDERGAYLIRDGIIQPAEPDYINADERLDKLAVAGDEWAKAERERRLRERIKWNVPEAAKAAVVQRFVITSSGRTVVGVNWCGGLAKKDPVGDAEPSKTAQTRARRRTWRQVADVLPDYRAIIQPIEEAAKGALPVLVVEPDAAPPTEARTQNLGVADDPYRLNAGTIAPIETKREETDAALLAEDRELADRELADREPGDETENAELPLKDRRPHRRD